MSKRSAVVDCQSRLAFPYYDPAPLDSLHLTVDRIARAGELSPERLRAIQNDARRGLGDMTPFELAIGTVRRVPSAIIFDVAPARKISELRAKLRGGPSIGASESCTPPLPHAPHVTIAYGNADGIAPPESKEAVAAVNRSVRMVRVRVSEISMVLLHRRRSMYSWDLIGGIPLGESI